MEKKLNKGLLYVFVGLLFFLVIETFLLFFYTPASYPTQIGPLINENSLWALTFLKKGLTEEVNVYTRARGKIIKIISKGTTPSKALSIKTIIYGTSPTFSQRYAFTEETLKVTSVFDKNNQPIPFSSLKIGDDIEINDTTSLIGDCSNDVCVKEVIIRVK